jgi:hypothetical protein
MMGEGTIVLKSRNEGEEAENRTLESTKERPETIKSASREKKQNISKCI